MFGKKKSKINWKKASKVINEVADYATMALNTITIVEGVHFLYKTFRRVDKKVEATTAEAKVAEPAAEAAAPAQA